MIPKLIPGEQSRPLLMAIAYGKTGEAIRLIETHHIDVNSFCDDHLWTPLLMEALNAYSREPGEGRFAFLKWLLEKGANPNLYCKWGYNCLHVAAQQPALIGTVELFLGYRPDVNVHDNNGANLVYWAIQAFPWRTAGLEKDRFLQVLERIVMLGADLDQANRYGVTPRKWLEHVPEEVGKLVARCEALHPVKQVVTTDQPEFPSNLKYPDVARKIWKELVPPMGHSSSVQGELLRVVEKLRDEAQRNGNVNFRNEHKRMAAFLQDTLVNSRLFDATTVKAIKDAVGKISKASVPYIEDDVYDFLTDQVCVFYMKNSALIPFKAPA